MIICLSLLKYINILLLKVFTFKNFNYVILKWKWSEYEYDKSSMDKRDNE